MKKFLKTTTTEAQESIGAPKYSIGDEIWVFVAKVWQRVKVLAVSMRETEDGYEWGYRVSCVFDFNGDFSETMIIKDNTKTATVDEIIEMVR